MKDVKQIISENLTALRKDKKLTQSDLAEMINYSDKAISKWEHAEALPDITVLHKLASIYGVTLDFLVTDGAFNEKKKYLTHPNEISNKVIITLLSIILVWALATIIFIYCILYPEVNTWLDKPWVIFVWAVPLSCVVTFAFNYVWGKRKWSIYINSLFIWSMLTSIYLQLLPNNFWPIFILGAPVQIALILWSQIKRSHR